MLVLFFYFKVDQLSYADVPHYNDTIRVIGDLNEAHLIHVNSNVLEKIPYFKAAMSREWCDQDRQLLTFQQFNVNLMKIVMDYIHTDVLTLDLSVDPVELILAVGEFQIPGLGLEILIQFENSQYLRQMDLKKIAELMQLTELCLIDSSLERPFGEILREVLRDEIDRRVVHDSELVLEIGERKKKRLEDFLVEREGKRIKKELVRHFLERDQADFKPFEYRIEVPTELGRRLVEWLSSQNKTFKFLLKNKKKLIFSRGQKMAQMIVTRKPIFIRRRLTGVLRKYR